jgi:hypothetical protein
VTHLPFNIRPTSGGALFRHVGVTVRLERVPLFFKDCNRRPPAVYYVGDEGFFRSYWRALKNNCLVKMPIPWKIKIVHGLNEHQRRLDYVKKLCQEMQDPILTRTLDEIYESLVLDPDLKRRPSRSLKL